MNARKWWPLPPAIALAIVLASCARQATAPVIDVAPEANSATNAIRRLVWTWNHPDADAYSALFTADFEFAYALADSAGWIETPGDMPYPSGVMSLDARLASTPDPRPGHNSRWHQVVRSSIRLAPRASATGALLGDPAPAGATAFYVVRGDSAVLDPHAVALGMADSTRWYVERWEALMARSGSLARPARPGGGRP